MKYIYNFFGNASQTIGGAGRKKLREEDVDGGVCFFLTEIIAVDFFERSDVVV